MTGCSILPQGSTAHETHFDGKHHTHQGDIFTQLQFHITACQFTVYVRSSQRQTSLDEF
jgi:hypothetical protein